MKIKLRIFILLIPLMMAACTKWGPDKKANRAVTLYADVELTVGAIIPVDTICRIDQRLSMGKIYGFHKIECKNGQSGYLMLGGDSDEQAFEATH